jgi:hypothetical protein
VGHPVYGPYPYSNLMFIDGPKKIMTFVGHPFFHPPITSYLLLDPKTSGNFMDFQPHEFWWTKRVHWTTWVPRNGLIWLLFDAKERSSVATVTWKVNFATKEIQFHFWADLDKISYLVCSRPFFNFSSLQWSSVTTKQISRIRDSKNQFCNQGTKFHFSTEFDKINHSLFAALFGL